MIIIPAIDLKDHQVVRLSQGKMDQSIIYSSKPLEMAKKWVKAGAKRIHLVDLNGAFEGKPIHFNEVKIIARNFPGLEIEIGGGIRDLETVIKYIDCGVKYCILGTAAIKNPDFLKKACLAYPNQIILGVDAKDGLVATEGWDDVSELTTLDLILKFKDQKLASVIYTDISKDGMLEGMSHSSIQKIASQSPFPIIGSGGVTSLDDIKKLNEVPNVSGVIVGKALYEGKVDLREAIEMVNGEW